MIVEMISKIFFIIQYTKGNKDLKQKVIYSKLKIKVEGLKILSDNKEGILFIPPPFNREST